MTSLPNSVLFSELSLPEFSCDTRCQTDLARRRAADDLEQDELRPVRADLSQTSQHLELRVGRSRPYLRRLRVLLGGRLVCLVWTCHLSCGVHVSLTASAPSGRRPFLHGPCPSTHRRPPHMFHHDLRSSSYSSVAGSSFAEEEQGPETPHPGGRVEASAGYDRIV